MRAVQLLMIVLCSAVPVAAFANDENPPIVRREYGLRSDPACTLCHTVATGVKGTATKPFARSLRQLGVSGLVDPDALVAALSEIRACEIDSDGDGASDFDELASSEDPNDGAGPATSSCEATTTERDVPLPRHGCSVSRAGGTERSLPLLGLVALGLLHYRRRISRSRRLRPERS